MRDSRRINRMGRNNRKVTGLGLNLIPMMDVLTVLVLFLLFHSFNGEMPEQRIELPDSVVETRPRETLNCGMPEMKLCVPSSGSSTNCKV